VLERALRRARGNQRQPLRRIESRFVDELEANGIKARVTGREKHLYSIYKKMLRKHVHLAEIVDVFGIRIVVPDVDSCYRVLGLAHQLYKPMPGRVKDYIAIPRVDGYQPPHTTPLRPDVVPSQIPI